MVQSGCSHSMLCRILVQYKDVYELLPFVLLASVAYLTSSTH